MKLLSTLLTLAALELMFVPPARGANAYVARRLFELPAAGAPGRSLDYRTLNNRGEVLYRLSDNRPGVWLPKASYGRPSGANDLTGFLALPGRTILGFNDQGDFFHLSVDSSKRNGPLPEIYTVYRGNVAGGESSIGSGFRGEDIPSRDNRYVERRYFPVEAITSTGQPVGKWRVYVKIKEQPDQAFQWDAHPKGPAGVFRGDTVLPLPGSDGLPLACASANVPAYRIAALSPGGTMLLSRSDGCPDLIQTLVVNSSRGDRIIARSGAGPSTEIEPLALLSAVNDAGAAAGVDTRGLWVSSPEGKINRSVVTDIQAIHYNDAGQLYVLRTNDVHLWSPGGELFPIGLSWGELGYQSSVTLYDVNNRSEFLFSAKSSTDGKTYAVLLSPMLSVSLLASTNRTDLGEFITVTAILTSLSDQPLTSVSADGPLTWRGSGEWEGVSGPEPGQPFTLGPGAITNLVWRLKSAQRGEGHFSLLVRANAGSNVVKTAPAFSETVRMRALGPDLLIKRRDEPALDYSGNLEFHPVAVESQTRTSYTLLGRSTEFDILLGNKGKDTNRFILNAVEDNSPGWRFTYVSEGAEITDSIRSQAGWKSPELLPGKGVSLRLSMTPVSAATNSETSVRILASFDTQPRATEDLVEARTSVGDLVVTFTPSVAILGEYVDVKLEYRNSSSQALTDITPDLHIIGGGGGYAEGEISPLRLEALAPGSTAAFTQKYVATNTGLFRFSGVIQAIQGNQQSLRAGADSTFLPVGSVRLLKADPFQVLPDATLIQGKSSVASIVLTNSSSATKRIVLEITSDGLSAGTESFDVPPASETKGYSRHLFEMHNVEQEVVAQIYPENGDPSFEYPGSSLTQIAKATSTQRLMYRFAYLTFPPTSGIPSIPRERAGQISERDSEFIQAVYPMAPQGPVGPPIQIPISERLLPRLSTWGRLMLASEGIARRLHLDRAVVIFPRHDSIWPAIPNIGTAVGWAYLRPHAIKHVVSVATDSPDNVTSAHEIGHTFGLRDVIHPTVRTVPEAFWPEARQSLEDVWDMMDYAQPNWINRAHYELLVKEFTQPKIDPEVLLISGMLDAQGNIDAFPWHTVFLNEADQPESSGTHSVEFRDAQGIVLSSFPFTPGFEAIGDSFSTNQTEEALVRFAEAPFIFSIPRPAGLTAIRLTKGQEVLYERAVTPNPPLVDFAAPLGGEVFHIGQVFRIRWNASDADGGSLTSTLFFSDDGGAQWSLVQDLLQSSEMDWVVPDQPTRKGRLKLQTTDGVNTTERLSPEFTIQGTTQRLIASAGPDQDATVGVLVTLDGRGSHSSDGEPLTFAWHTIAVPGPTRLTLLGGDTPQPAFSPNAAGHYSFRLRVTDPTGNAAESMVSVHVNEPLVALRARSITPDQLELSWNDPSGHYELEVSSELGAPIDWRRVAVAPGLADGQREITLGVSEGRRFYRLRRPESLPTSLVLQRDQDLRLGDSPLTLASLDLKSFRLTVSGPGQLVVRSVVGTPASRLTVQGPGEVEIADTLPGTLEVRGGRVALATAALNTATAVEMTGGRLVLPAGGTLNSTAALRVSGGVLEINGAHGDLGALELAGAATLQLGEGIGALTLASGRLAGAGGQLTVEGWKGAGGSTGTGRTLFVKTTPDEEFRSHVTFVGPAYDPGAILLPTRELVPPAKPSMIVPTDFASYLTYGGVTKATVAVTGQSFSQALRLTTTQPPTQVFNAGVQTKTTLAVAANDNLLARFWVRKVAPATGNVQTMFNFELGSGTFEKSAQLLVTMSDTEWQLKTVRFKSRAAYTAGAAQVSFWTGYALQTIEIGGLEVLNYGTTTPP